MVRMTMALLTLWLSVGMARAQDVPGIEICTVEKTMERRTSCLQSNVDFLMKTLSKLGRDQQLKLDAANRQIEALKASLVGLQSTVDELKAAQTKSAPAEAAPQPKDQAKDQPAKDLPAKDQPAKDAAK